MNARQGPSTATWKPRTSTRDRSQTADGQGLPAALDSVFRVLREKGTRSLVLDLRGNGGGVDEYGALLLS